MGAVRFLREVTEKVRSYAACRSEQGTRVCIQHYGFRYGIINGFHGSLTVECEC